MTVSAVEAASVQNADFRAARSKAHAWRGSCINKLAEVEQRLSSVLARAAREPAYSGTKPVFPHLVGQKFLRLRKLLELTGPLRQHSKALLPSLDSFAAFDELRAHLCHGSLTVAAKDDGEMLYIFTMLRLVGGIQHVRLTLTQCEADQVANELGRVSNVLKKQLETLGKALPSVPLIPLARSV